MIYHCVINDPIILFTSKILSSAGAGLAQFLCYGLLTCDQ